MNSPTSPTFSKNPNSKTPAREQKLKSSAASATPFKSLSTPARRSNAIPTDLPTKISQLKTTIDHTQRQLTETLDKLAGLPPDPEALPVPQHGSRFDSYRRRGGLSNATTFTAISTTPDLTAAQREMLSGAQRVLDGQIKALGQYNELKDAGMMMMGLIAEREGRVVKEVMGERGVGEDD